MEPVAEREILGRVQLLTEETRRLRGEVAFLEAEVLAMGNILLKKGGVTLEELRHYTSLALKERENREREERKQSPYGMTREELQDSLTREANR